MIRTTGADVHARDVFGNTPDVWARQAGIRAQVQESISTRDMHQSAGSTPSRKYTGPGGLAGVGEIHDQYQREDISRADVNAEGVDRVSQFSQRRSPDVARKSPGTSRKNGDDGSSDVEGQDEFAQRVDVVREKTERGEQDKVDRQERSQGGAEKLQESIMEVLNSAGAWWNRQRANKNGRDEGENGTSFWKDGVGSAPVLWSWEGREQSDGEKKGERRSSRECFVGDGGFEKRRESGERGMGIHEIETEAAQVCAHLCVCLFVSVCPCFSAVHGWCVRPSIYALQEDT